MKPKKSVALSGTVAGNTALCTVGRTGNDLHYRGYDILDIADVCEFEEIAHLIVYEKLPTTTELTAYKNKLRSLRAIPAEVKACLEQLPASTHPMDILRTACSVLGTVIPEKEDHNSVGARDIADRLMASFGSMLLYWYHYKVNAKRIEVETDDDSIGGHFLHLLHNEEPPDEWVRAMHTSLILYAEHEYNASTFTARCFLALPVPLEHYAGQNMVAQTKWLLKSNHVIATQMKPKQTFANVWHVRRS
jgi:2-methylcitrate synthase